MNLDRVLGNALLDEECGDLQPLITLELDDLAGLLIINESTVAGKFLWCRTTISHSSSCHSLAV